MKKIYFFSLIVAIAAINVNAQSAQVKDELVTYNGEEFTISVFNQEEAEKIIRNAAAVYAVQISDKPLSTAENGDTFTAYKKGNRKYAIKVPFIMNGKKSYKYIIFNKKWIKIKDRLPEGYNVTSDRNGFVGYGKYAGYAFADLNGCHNSVIVYVNND